MKLIYKDVYFENSCLESKLLERKYNPEQHYCIINNNKLYISKGKIPKNKYDIYSKVFTEDKFAEWVNQTIYIRFHDNYHHSSYYDFTLEINIEKGILTNKRLIINFIQRYKKFYKKEFCPKRFYTKSVIKENLIKILEKTFDESTKNKWLNKISELLEIIYTQRNDFNSKKTILSHVELTVSESFIFFHLGSDKLNEYTSQIIEYYINYLNENFKNQSGLTYNQENYINYQNEKATNQQLLGSVYEDSIVIYKPFKIDFPFIKWAIRNLSWFVLCPSFFKETFILEKSIKLKKVNNVMFKYEIEKEKIYISDFLDEEDFKLNFEKINLKFDSEKNEFSLIELNGTTFTGYLMNDTEYQDLLDAKYHYKNLGEEIDKRNRTSDFTGDSNTSYSNKNWLIDAAGNDDPETMGDVYWNLD